VDFLLSFPEKATDGGLQAEDWTLNMEICDIINETEEGPKDAIRALKKRLSGNRNYREVMLGLTVLETCVKNCGHRFHVLVANRDFIDGVLVKIISPKTNPPTIVQDKVLALIQGLPEVDPAVLKYKAPIQPHAAATATLPKPAAAPAPAPVLHTPVLQIPHIPNVQGPITANPEQIARLRSELDIVRGNTKVMSEMLTEMVPGQEDSSDLELLQELNRTCRAMQQRVVELISRVSNEEVTEELLHVNDDLNNIFLRYERYERYRLGRAVQNNGMLSEATEDNLIDLTPGSPAVVTSPARALIQDPTSGPSTLSTQLAGLDVGGDSVSGTLSSLSGHNPGDDFDMFAQTRTSSLADQRKNVKYEDPRALGGLASALDVRQQNATGGVSAPKHSTTDSPFLYVLLLTGVFSPLPLEFDKFLEDRTKVVDSLPSLPGDEPGPPLSAPSGTRKKAERTEDALFAL
uniref:Target of myb1 like 2 membrane trafficking protein n=1 Tax=Salmo trutta TaxID=8032 RepID=A0A673X543_SALTR